MKKMILYFCLFLATSSSFAQELNVKLENAYNSFNNAIKAKDANMLKKAMSSYAYMNTKNQMVSTGAKFPDDFFNSAKLFTPVIKKLNFIKTAQNGPTAYAYYWAKGDFKEKTLYIFKYLEENEEWKFNLIEAKVSDKVTAAVESKNFDFLNSSEYSPDGLMPQTPKEATAGDYKARLNVFSSGFEVEVSVNGIPQKKVSYESNSAVVIGGIKKGNNTVEIKVVALKKDAGSFPLTVKINTLINSEEKEVFSYREKTNEGTITKEFTVN